MPNNNFTYEFTVLSAELRVFDQWRRSVTLILQLIPSPQEQLPLIYMLGIGSDYSQNTAHFGANEWIMHSVFLAAKQSKIPIQITLNQPINQFTLPENDTAYGQYSLNPGWLPFLSVIEIILINKVKPSNYYKFNWTKKPSIEGSTMSTFDIEKLSKPAEDIKQDARPLLRTTFSRGDLTFRENGKLYGNFSSSFSGACIAGPSYSYIEEGAITSVNAMPNRCADGNIVLLIEYN